MNSVRTIDHAGSWALGRLRDRGGRVFPAFVAHEWALDLSVRPDLGRPSSTADLLERWDEALPVLEGLVGAVEGWLPVAEHRVLSPVEPRQIFQAGANYRTHVIDIAVAHHDPSDGRTTEQVRADAAAEMDTRLQHPPYVFQGLPSAICGPWDDVVLPSDGRQPDWELELAAVIGRRARRVSPENALDVVAGWTIVNDLTLRERIFRTDIPALGADWLAAKNSPTFLPTGPVLVPRATLADLGDRET
ncbi:fumarylacetoacetate hydrolase family protein [Candidatus Frankia nodulisporulans]|uniref:fumarylacetoacetate hydrolase family protein n=1 Tax=Candidatus Frankia nodulisporulans TaxID=2060052 RepID=UPI001CDC58FB|nr:fumarylacetoacetate hydrolase family protein [Candidatus Frankia nodulisporulans]